MLTLRGGACACVSDSLASLPNSNSRSVMRAEAVGNMSGCTSRSAPGPTQPPIQRMPVVTRPECEPPSKNSWSCTFKTWLRHSWSDFRASGHEQQSHCRRLLSVITDGEMTCAEDRPHIPGLEPLSARVTIFQAWRPVYVGLSVVATGHMFPSLFPDPQTVRNTFSR